MTLQIVEWVGISRSKFYDWRNRYGKINEHNALIPRNHWIETWERDAIIKLAQEFPLEGYRRLTFMVLDRDVVAVSPSTTYRVLSTAGLIQKFNGKPSRKGTGFVQPLAPHEHWHVDVSYMNVAGTFYYLCSLLDGCSRSIVHHELRESMTETHVEIIIQRALEKYKGAKPCIALGNSRLSVWTGGHGKPGRVSVNALNNGVFESKINLLSNITQVHVKTLQPLYQLQKPEQINQPLRW